MLPLLVTAAIIERNGKYLLTRRRADSSYPLFWEFPGGKLEPEEDPHQCVVRELMEELAIVIEVVAVFDVIYHRYPELPVIVLAYRCRWLSGDIRNIEVAEHQWLHPAAMTNLQMLPADIPLVERLNRERSNADSTCL